MWWLLLLGSHRIVPDSADWSRHLFSTFNYGWDNLGFTGASRSGASVQCGFDMPGCTQGEDGKAGQVAHIKIMIAGEVATEARTVGKEG